MISEPKGELIVEPLPPSPKRKNAVSPRLTAFTFPIVVPQRHLFCLGPNAKRREQHEVPNPFCPLPPHEPR
jgi:hypothetical protein